MEEIWKKIDGYDNYFVSSEGKVRNDKTGRILKVRSNKEGYLRVNLCKNGKMTTFTIHRLVAQAFLPNPKNLPCVDHINTIKNDNRMDNLRWCSQKGNCNNPLSRINNSKAQKGENNPNLGSLIVQVDKLTNKVVNVKYNFEFKEMGFTQSSISHCCVGRINEYKGYRWYYLQDYIQQFGSIENYSVI